jgi:hypothetical protein
VLERFRQRLLQRFLSLHDAFSRLDHGVSRDRALTTKEFHHALERLGVGQEDAAEIFVAMDTNKVGVVSLSELLHARVDVYPQALLWELRCRLLQSNIGVRNLKRALELVRWPQHGWRSKATELKRRTTRGARDGSTSAPSEQGHDLFPTADSAVDFGDSELNNRVDATSLASSLPKTSRSPYHLNRGDWLKLATSIYLTLLEAERLFAYLADETGHVDLRDMFELLRTTVEPDVTLERFATKVIAQYDTLENAFDTFCEAALELEREDTVLRWDGFHALAVVLHVNNENAAKIWSMLTGVAMPRDALGTGPESPGATDDDGTCSWVSRGAFVAHLSLWGPDSALRALKEHLCERFGNLAECQRVLHQRLTDTKTLSATEFDAALRAEGIKNCDVHLALRTVATRRGLHDKSVSLETTINAMRALRHGDKSFGARSCARSTVKHETLPIWEQLREVRNDLAGRRDGPDDAACRTGSPERRIGTPPGLLPTVADRRRFSEAVHGAVKSAETSRSKSVLQSAHRQVLRLEERWATSAGEPQPGCNSKAIPAPKKKGEEREGTRRCSHKRDSAVMALRAPESAAVPSRFSSSGRSFWALASLEKSPDVLIDVQ